MGKTWWPEDEAIKIAAEHLGFQRVGESIREAFRSAINGLLRQERLERDGERLRVVV
jgi:hypothetical protein